jgi:hypothetical protein
VRANRVPELLARYHLGLVPANVGRRLARIFMENPRDAIDRLERAAIYLRITGEYAEELLDRAAQRGYQSAINYLEETERTG